jgi:thymidylate synthase
VNNLVYDEFWQVPPGNALRDLNEAWLNALYFVTNYGAIVVPRGRATQELVGHPITVDMTRCVLTIRERALGYRFMCAEAAWMLSGDDRVKTIAPYSKTIANFSDDDKTFFGAYGPKLRMQLKYIIDCLRADPESRQAVANIWRESPLPTKDYPCHLSAQFLIRRSRLHLIVTMRSSDLWLGVPYDIFNFSMWAAYVALELGRRDLKLGMLHNTAGSRHLYDTNLNGAVTCLADRAPRFEYAPLDWTEFDNGQELINHLWWHADKKPTKHRWLKELP